MDVESKDTINQAIDRAQAAAQQLVVTVNQDLNRQVGNALMQLDALGTSQIKQLETTIAPVLAEVQAFRLELAEWRKLIAGGLKIGPA